jgi:hypothetical protein
MNRAVSLLRSFYSMTLPLRVERGAAAARQAREAPDAAISTNCRRVTDAIVTSSKLLYYGFQNLAPTLVNVPRLLA